MTAQNKFNELLDATKKHLPKKDYYYTKKGEAFYNKLKDWDNIPEAEKSKTKGVFSKEILLSMAFNLALKNIEALKNNSFIFENYFSRIVNLKNATTKKEKKEIEEINRIKLIIPQIYDKLRNYNSHYFHEPSPLLVKDVFNIAHENIIKQDDWDFFIQWVKKLFTINYERITASLEEKQIELNAKTIDTNTEEGIKLINDKIDIEAVIKLFNHIKFDHIDEFGNKIPSHNARLYMASLFLKKNELHTILRKWQRFEKNEGFYSKIGEFFGKYSIKESANLFADDYKDILLFKKITSQLCTIPMIINEALSPLYEHIRLKNDEYAKKLLKLENKRRAIKDEQQTPTRRKDIIESRKKSLEDINKQIKETRKNIIPIRKRNNWVHWMMVYLTDNGLFKNNEENKESLKVGYVKSALDYKHFYENELKSVMSSTEIKDKIKEINKIIKDKKSNNEDISEDIIEWNKWKNHYKFIKNKYTLDEAKLSDKVFYTHKNNIILELNFEYKDVPVSIKAVVSGWYLLKWVFIDLDNHDNGLKVKDKLINYIKDYYKMICEKSIEEIKDIQFFKNAIPTGLTYNYNDRSDNDYIERLAKIQKTGNTVESVIKHRVEELEEFKKLNNSQRPHLRYKFASKEKINWILLFARFKFIENAIRNNKTESDIVHNSLGADQYMQAFEVIRFFRRKKGSDEYNEVFKNPYFSCLKKYIDNSNSLEDLFNFSIDDYITSLNTISIKSENDRFIYSKVFKLKLPSLQSVIKKHITNSYIKSIAIPHEAIDFNDYGININSLNFEIKKKVKSNRDNSSCFSYIRHTLENKNGNSSYSNTDYLLSVILNGVLNDKNNCDKVLDKKENDKKVVKSAIFKHLLNLKTVELTMWAIAKSYWKKSFTEELNLTFTPNKEIDSNTGKPKNTAFFEWNTYYNIMQNDIIIPLKVEQGPNYYIAVPAKKMDDEYLHFEATYLNKFLKYYKNELDAVLLAKKNNIKNESIWSKLFLNNKIDEQTKIILNKKIINSNNILRFVPVNQFIKSKIIQSFEDIYIVLQNERFIINKEQQKGNLFNTLIVCNDPINTFYIPFDEIESFFKNNILDINKYKYFRNFALHIELQDPSYYEIYKKVFREFYINNEIYKYYIDKNIESQRKWKEEKRKQNNNRYSKK